jgi:hypothetical protein
MHVDEEPLPVPPAPDPLVLVEPRAPGRRSPRATVADVAACRAVLRRYRGRVLTMGDVEMALASARRAR